MCPVRGVLVTKTMANKAFIPGFRFWNFITLFTQFIMGRPLFKKKNYVGPAAVCNFRTVRYADVA